MLRSVPVAMMFTLIEPVLFPGVGSVSGAAIAALFGTVLAMVFAVATMAMVGMLV